MDNVGIYNSSSDKNSPYLSLEIVLPPDQFKTTKNLQQKHQKPLPDMSEIEFLSIKGKVEKSNIGRGPRSFLPTIFSWWIYKMLTFLREYIP